MADKESDDLKREASDDLLGPVSKKPRDGNDQSQGSEPQDTQPIEKLQDVGDPAMPECPTKDYEWKICDLSSDEEANEISSFLKKEYLNMDPDLDIHELEYQYSKDYLRWSLCPPGFQKDWHIGVQHKVTKQLVAFVAAVPTNMRLHGENVQMAEVKFLCILDTAELRDQQLDYHELQPLLFKEMARRVQNIVYASRRDLIHEPPRSNPNNEPIITCPCWIRPLNLTKLFDLEFLPLMARMNFYRLPTSPLLSGLRKMEATDVPSVTNLLKTYLNRFDVAPVFNEAEVEHWFLPREDIIESYVVESENKDITHFISFSILTFSMLRKNDSTIKSACSLYNVSTIAQPRELLLNAVELANMLKLDIFQVLGIMDNESPILNALKFRADMEHYYYLFDDSRSKKLKPSEVGLVMFVTNPFCVLNYMNI